MGAVTLTISADEDLVRRLEQMAADQKTDVNSFVARVLEVLARRDWSREPIHPVAQRALGLAAGLTDRPYKELLEEAIWEKHMGEK